MVAMGRMDLAIGGVRVSGGWGTAEDDWSRFAAAWTKAYETQRARQAQRVKEPA
jgi:cysteine desulfurase